jgi:hypothetical protein
MEQAPDIGTLNYLDSRRLIVSASMDGKDILEVVVYTQRSAAREVGLILVKMGTRRTLCVEGSKLISTSPSENRSDNEHRTDSS